MCLLMKVFYDSLSLFIIFALVYKVTLGCFMAHSPDPTPDRRGGEAGPCQKCQASVVCKEEEQGMERREREIVIGL